MNDPTTEVSLLGWGAASFLRPCCLWLRTEKQRKYWNAVWGWKPGFKTWFEAAPTCLGACLYANKCDGGTGLGAKSGCALREAPVNKEVCSAISFLKLIFLEQALGLYLFPRSLQLIEWPNTIVWQWNCTSAIQTKRPSFTFVPTPLM